MLWEAVKLALSSIRRNKLRSVLTLLGIVIGVAAVIAMVTLGSGASSKVRENLAKLGSNLLIARPGQSTFGPGGATDSRAFDERERRHQKPRTISLSDLILEKVSQSSRCVS